jgi:putative chitinase
MITIDQLHKIMPLAGACAETFIEPLNNAMFEFGICSDLRAAAFLAQIAHESGELKYTQEIASGKAYEGRVDLGNTVTGDGPRFKGRGLIQVTGRTNYRLCGDALVLNLLEHPEWLAQPVNACRSAAWFWQTHGLNALADHRAFRNITRIINGGYNGEAAREAYYSRALNVLHGGLEK